MSETKTDPVVHGPSAETKRLTAEMKELEVLYPEYDDKANKADWKWIDESLMGMPNDWPYRNKLIAVYNKAIVGTGSDEMQLMIDLSRKLKVNPYRIVVTVIGEEDY